MILQVKSATGGIAFLQIDITFINPIIDETENEDVDELESGENIDTNL